MASKIAAAVTPANHIRGTGLLKGKVAIITGASSGIGADTARVFAAEGAKVVVSARRLENLHALVKEIKANGGEAFAVQIDVTKEEDAKKLVDTALKQYGALHIAFNNAGFARFGPLTEAKASDINDLLNTNVAGVLLGMKHQIPALIASGPDGVIINNSSVAGLTPSKALSIGISVYAGTKAFLNQVTQVAAIEQAGKVRINAILPGPVTSEATANMPQEVMQQILGKILIPRMGSGQEIGDAVAFLASDKAKFITGALFVVDGGATLA